MNIAIIDDVQEEIKELTDTLGQQLSSLDHMEYQLHTYHSGEEFLSDWTSNNFDLIILDIFMDKLTGIDVARKVRETDKYVPLVFCTTSNEFASESYELNAHFYLHKPYSKDQIKTMLSRLNISQLEERHAITLPDGQNVILRSIRYTEYSNHVLIIHTRKNEDIRVYMSQSKAEEILCAYPYFLVCTKGIIVNLYEVENLKKDQIHLTGGITLPVSRRRAKDVQDQFAAFTFDRMRREADF